MVVVLLRLNSKNIHANRVLCDFRTPNVVPDVVAAIERAMRNPESEGIDEVVMILPTVSHIFALHRMRLQLLDPVMLRLGILGDAENPADVLIQPMHRQRFQTPINRRQRLASDTPLLGLEFPRQKVRQNTQRRKIAIRRRHRDESRPFVNYGEHGIQVEQ
jgi:hypothetical protein